MVRYQAAKVKISYEAAGRLTSRTALTLSAVQPVTLLKRKSDSAQDIMAIKFQDLDPQSIK